MTPPVVAPQQFLGSLNVKSWYSPQHFYLLPKGLRMKLSNVTGACLIAAMAATGATRVAADDAGAAIAGALVGGIIGHAIAKDQQRSRTTVVRRTYKPQVSSAQRDSNRQMQNALNYFGFNAGAVDGAVGPGTRGAVSRFQAQMSYPASGWIQPHERDFLMSAYSWASSGGAATSGATTPQGQLLAYRRVLAGQTMQPQVIVPPATTVVVAPQATQAPQQAAPPQQVEVAAPAALEEPAEEVAIAAAPLLPNLMGEAAGVSLASHCNRVSLLTNTNGGFVTEATMTDPAFTLEEQFCLARTYAISEGEELVSKVQNLSPQQVADQCAAFAPALREHVSALSLKPRDQVVEDVSNFILTSGMSPSQLSGTAKICLSVGYRTDDMDIALGSALVLVALGEGVYGELMGHHLAQGFGTSKRADLSLAWYEMGLDAVEGGGRAVFAPGQPSRQSLIRKAAYQLGGGQSDAAATPDASPATIPTFALAD